MLHWAHYWLDDWRIRSSTHANQPVFNSFEYNLQEDYIGIRLIRRTILVSSCFSISSVIWLWTGSHRGWWRSPDARGGSYHEWYTSKHTLFVVLICHYHDLSHDWTKLSSPPIISRYHWDWIACEGSTDCGAVPQSYSFASILSASTLSFILIPPSEDSYFLSREFLILSCLFSQRIGPGKIVTLVGPDADAVEKFFQNAYYLWASPLQIIVRILLMMHSLRVLDSDVVNVRMEGCLFFACTRSSMVWCCNSAISNDIFAGCTR